MSAFSNNGDVFTDPEIAAPGNAHLGGHWRPRRVTQRPHPLSHHAPAPVHGEFRNTGAASLTVRTSGLRQATCPRTFLSFTTSVQRPSPAPSPRASHRQARTQTPSQASRQQSTPSASSSQPRLALLRQEIRPHNSQLVPLRRETFQTPIQSLLHGFPAV